MAHTLTRTDLTFTPPQRRLLGGWRDILDDVRLVAHTIGATSSTCDCGASIVEPEGACPCCHEHDSSSTSRHCESCSARMIACRAQIDTLLVDTLRFFPAFTLILAGTHPLETQTAAETVQHEIAMLVRSFERLAVISDAQALRCRASRLSMLTAAAGELQGHADALERLL